MARKASANNDRVSSGQNGSWARSKTTGAEIEPVLANVALALRGAPELADAFRFDELQRLVIVVKTLPCTDGAERRNTAVPGPLSNADVSQVQEWLQHAGMPRIGREIVHQAIALRAQERAFHPIRDYLDGLQWDGVLRLELMADDLPWRRANPLRSGDGPNVIDRRRGADLFAWRQS